MAEITFDDLIPKKPSEITFDDLIPDKSQSLSGLVKAGASGLMTGVEGLIGLPGDIQSGAGRLAGYAAGRLGAEPETQQRIETVVRRLSPMSGFQQMPTSGNVRQAVQQTTGIDPYQPQTTAEKYVRTGAEFLPAAAGFGAPGGLRAAGHAAAKYGILPGLASEAAGQATEGTGAEPYARVAAAIAAPVGVNALKRVVTPAPVKDMQHLELVKALERSGVTDLSAGTKTGSKALRYLEETAAPATAESQVARTKEQFTQAALRSIGSNAKRATTNAMDDAFDTIGKKFDDLAASTNTNIDRRLVDDVHNVWNDYAEKVAPSVRPAALENVIRGIGESVQNNVLSGVAYKSMRTRIDRMMRGTKDADLKMALGDLKNAVDDAVERSLASMGDDVTMSQWREVRNQYRNALVVERAAAGAGEEAAKGLISPSALRGASKAVYGTRAYVRGKGDLSELGRAGEGVFKALPQSGTQPRTTARNLFAGIPTVLGAGTGAGITGGMEGAMIGGALGHIAPYGVGKAMMSPIGKAYLSNQIIGPSLTPAHRAVAAALANASLPVRLPPPVQ